MSRISQLRWRGVAIAFTLSLLLVLSSTLVASAGGIKQISTDPYTNTTSQHKTELEPDTFAFGNTIVATFQVGRFFSGGASNIGWATSKDGGKTWKHGFLPGTSVYATPPGKYLRVSDPVVAYDAKHKVWLISLLGLFPGGNGSVVDALTSRSTDGGLTWSKPFVTAANNQFYDKNWIVCDTTASSPFYGNCYTEFDNNTVGDLILMSTSHDGGKTWGAPKPTADHNFGIGGQPLVQPNGRVVVPIIGFRFNASQPFNLLSFISTNGGASWSSTVKIAGITFHVPEGGLRASIPLPSAEIDASGKVYVVWSDCRFEPQCTRDDIVMATSNNGLVWSGVGRVPIDAVGSTIDHFIPGIAVDRSTSGSSAHIGLAFYYYPVANCQPITCRLTVGFVSSTNGGASWSGKQRISPAMLDIFLANTTQGYMVGDYMSTSILPGANKAYPVFAFASIPTPFGPCTASGVVCHEDMYTNAQSLVGGTNPLGNDRVYAAPSKPIPLVTTAY